MASDTYTSRVGLDKPYANAPAWDAALNANFDLLDAQNALGTLACKPAEYPSATLNVVVGAGRYMGPKGTPVDYAGGTATLPASATTLLWVDPTGAIVQGTAWPATAWHIPIASVVTGAAAVSLVTDERVLARGSTFTVGLPETIITAPTVTLDAVSGLFLFDATNNAIQATLASEPDGLVLYLVRTDSTTNAVLILAPSGQTINGATSYTLGQAYSTLTLIQCTDGNYVVTSTQ
jgi:hypothetical protein